MIGDLWIYEHDLPHVLLKVPAVDGASSDFNPGSNRAGCVPPWSGMIIVDEIESYGKTWHRVSSAGVDGWIENRWLRRRAHRAMSVKDV